MLLIRVFGLEQLNKFVYVEDLDMSLATTSLGTKYDHLVISILKELEEIDEKKLSFKE